MQEQKSNWQPLWWLDSLHGSSWTRSRESARQKWELSRCDARKDDSDDSTPCCHAVDEGRTGGSLPNEQKNWPDAEVSYRYGHAARRQFGGQYPVWGPELEAKLKQEWISYQDQIAHGWASARYFVRRGYEYKISFP